MGILQGFFFIENKTLASGGTTVDSDGFRIHVFTGTGPFNVARAGTVEYVVVAGGGGGNTGGGGAGGFRTGINLPVTVQDYTITVGGGGAPGSTNGGNSVFSTITSTGGGRGGLNPGVASSGGSGGGGGSPAPGASGNTPPTSPPQGNNGGNATPSLSGTPGPGRGGGGLRHPPKSPRTVLRLSVRWARACRRGPGPGRRRW